MYRGKAYSFIQLYFDSNIRVVSYILKSSPKDVLPDVTLSKGDDEGANCGYGEENDPSIKVIIKALLGLPIYRQLLVSASSTSAQSFLLDPDVSR